MSFTTALMSLILVLCRRTAVFSLCCGLFWEYAFVSDEPCFIVEGFYRILTLMATCVNEKKKKKKVRQSRMCIKTIVSVPC